MSWLLPREDDFLAGVSVGRLRRLLVEQPDGTSKFRLLAAIKRKEGRSMDEIATDLNRSRKTVHGWLWMLEERGLEGLSNKKQPGRARRLSDKQLQALRKDLLKKPTAIGYSEGFWSTKLVQEYVQKKHRILFVNRHMTRLLHRMGFSCKKPRPVHYKADKAEQNRFKKNSNAWFPAT